MTRNRSVINRVTTPPRIYGSASTNSGAFYNDGAILDQPLGTITPAQVAAARRVLDRHGAGDLAEMLGLEPAATTSPSPIEQGAAA